MKTQCSERTFVFQGFGKRDVVAGFDGGDITSDGGAVWLRSIDERTGLLEGFAACFRDQRDPTRVEHSVIDLVRQRVYGLALGYEDLVDHDELRRDPLLAAVVGKADPAGAKRKRERDVGTALAGKSTLNRLELTGEAVTGTERYKKVALDTDAVDDLLVDAFLDAHDEAPDWIELDVDATDTPLHGHQEGRFFHGYYGHYCYLPLYIFAGEHLLLARLRPSDIDASAGTREELARIVGRIRARWPETEILIRGDSGFAREELMSYCEDHGLWYVFGLARNSRLVAAIETELEEAKALCEETGKAARVFADFEYSTLESWSCLRRVVGKAEHLAKGANPRFVVTNLPDDVFDARTVYEEIYCARGDMENRIKEQQLYLFADRASAHTLRANQIRLYFSSLAYVLLSALRRVALAGTKLARAQCHTIRTKLLKIGAVVWVTVRKVWLALSSAHPYQRLFETIYQRLVAPTSTQN